MMLQLLFFLKQAIDPFLVPCCLTIAWLFSLAVVLTLLNFLKEFWFRSQILHQIPCSQCRFFSDDPYLKCTIHPHLANTEEAIHCRDFNTSVPPYPLTF